MKKVYILLLIFWYSSPIFSQIDAVGYLPTDTLIIRLVKADSSADNVSFRMFTQNGNNVLIESDDKSVIEHAAYELRNWGFWNVVKDENEADFILRFNFRNGIDAQGFAEFLEPSNKIVIKRTYDPQGVTLDFNKKRGTVKRIITKEIMPFFTIQ